ncbi:hypothetical protein N8G13_03125 [Mycoplasma zalophi]|uniref:hypothetical protein n=1 Tax=Mycoplasma zalophi TaxID=191287 RepID=UPI0021C82297|nr:hypothetical protein [Mycoplasma zalophi]MCU4117433.1 hypothetical protein [Mycoplasma zalophi]
MKFKFSKLEILILIITISILFSLILFLIFFQKLNFEYKKIKIIDNKQLIFETDLNLNDFFKINDTITLKINEKEIFAKLLSITVGEKGYFIFKIKFLNFAYFFKFSNVYLKITNFTEIIKFFR